MENNKEKYLQPLCEQFCIDASETLCSSFGTGPGGSDIIPIDLEEDYWD